MRQSRRGILYVLVLAFTAILLVLALASLGVQSPEARRAQAAVDAAQAYQLARAGVDDARTKLANDINFPPRMGLDQTTFAYSETVTDGAVLVGSYRVLVDCSMLDPPRQLYAVTAEGWTGSSQAPKARSTIRVWFDSKTMKVRRWDE